VRLREDLLRNSRRRTHTMAPLRAAWNAPKREVSRTKAALEIVGKAHALLETLS
jgi:hypothetical protein